MYLSLRNFLFFIKPKSTMNSITVGWFEIPATNMERAIAFYETVFNASLSRNQMGDLDMAWFPWDESNPSGAGGSLVKHEAFYKPSADGALVYFTSADVAVELARVEAAGGTILITKRLIAPEIGYMALFLDTEGNRVALHSRN
jgi:uncharacterized protein